MAAKKKSSLGALLPPEENPEDAKLSRRWRIAAWVGGGAVALIGIAALAKRLGGKKPKPSGVGLKVKPMCSGYTITDPLKLTNTLRKEIERSIDRKQPVEPFALTSRFLSQKRFSCPVYPNPSTPSAAELYVTIFGIITELMVQNGLASDVQRRTFDKMAEHWAKTQGAFPNNTFTDETESAQA